MEVFLNMENHAKNIELYLSLGGDPKIASKHKSANLQNRAKISYLLSKIPKSEIKAAEEKPVIVKQSEIVNTAEPEKVESNKPKFLGLITQYPVELHQAYNDAFAYWLQICSLKIQLNAVAPEERSAAYQIQKEMMLKFQKFDKCKDALDHYQENKRIFPTVAKNDFSGLSPAELITKRINIRSSITKRRQTIDKMEQNLPEESSPDYFKKLDSLNRKRESLQQSILDEEHLTELLHL